MEKSNISAWDAMMASVAGQPEIDRLRAEIAAMRQENHRLRLLAGEKVCGPLHDEHSIYVVLYPGGRPEKMSYLDRNTDWS